MTAICTSPGNHTDTEGLGAMSLSVYRLGHECPHLDLLEIFFQDVDVEDNQVPHEAHRRLSKKQATWLSTRLASFIASLGEIPADSDL